MTDILTDEEIQYTKELEQLHAERDLMPPRNPSYIDISSVRLWPEHWNVLSSSSIGDTNKLNKLKEPYVGWLGRKFGAKSGWERERSRTERYPRVVRVYIHDYLGNGRPDGIPRTKKINREDLSTANWQDIRMFFVSVLTDPKTNAYIGHLVASVPPLPTELDNERMLRQGVSLERIKELRPPIVPKTVICQTCGQPHTAAIDPGAFRPEHPNMDAYFMWLGAHPDCQDFPELNRNDANNGTWVEKFMDVRYFNVDSIEYWKQIQAAIDETFKKDLDSKKRRTQKLIEDKLRTKR